MTVYVAIAKHNFSADPDFKLFKTREKAINYIHKFFLGYGFSVKNKKAYDMDGEEFGESEYRIDKKTKKICYFVDADGDGPIGDIIKSKLNE